MKYSPRLTILVFLSLVSCSHLHRTLKRPDPSCEPPSSPLVVAEKTAPSLQEAIAQRIRSAEPLKGLDVHDFPSLPIAPLPLTELAHRLSGQGDLGEYTHLSFEERQKFQKAAREGWKGLTQRTLQPLWAWRSALQSERVARIFYPFGGPDVTYVTQLFPNAKEYILVGLEVPGTKRSAKNLFESNAKLALLRESMKTFYQKGFFVTHDMAVQLSSKKAVGVAPLILAQLAHLGYHVTSMTSLRKEMHDPSLRHLRGIKISFKDKEGHNKTLSFIQCRLDNDNAAQRQALCSFVSRTPFVTFIKSASYALHDSKVFFHLRQFLLDSSQAILQDDSGIPYKFLKKAFSVRLWGSYGKPSLPVFEKFYQVALQEAYAATSPEPLPFGLGYGCTHSPSHLLWATRPAS